MRSPLALVTALAFATALLLASCEDDPRDLDYLHDAGGAGSAASAPDAGSASPATMLPVPDAGSMKIVAPADASSTDDASTDDAG